MRWGGPWGKKQIWVPGSFLNDTFEGSLDKKIFFPVEAYSIFYLKGKRINFCERKPPTIQILRGHALSGILSQKGFSTGAVELRLQLFL
jgi:hypothetical protein